MADGGYADDDMNDSILARPSTSTEKDVETQSTTLGKVDSVLTDVSTIWRLFYCIDADRYIRARRKFQI